MKIMENEKTLAIYTGSVLMAEALAERLENVGVIAIIREDQQHAKMFGLGSNYTDQVRVFIRQDELAKAQPIITIFEEETTEH